MGSSIPSDSLVSITLLLLPISFHQNYKTAFDCCEGHHVLRYTSKVGASRVLSTGNQLLKRPFLSFVILVECSNTKE